MRLRFFHGKGWRLMAGAALAAAAAGVAGCVNQAKEVQIYRDVLDQGAPKPKPLEPGERLTLDRAFALANADNEQLASQGETYLQAVIAKSRAFGAFLPTVSFQPNFVAEQAPKGTASGGSPGAPAASAASVAASQGGYVQNGGILHRFEAPVVGDMSFSVGSMDAYKGIKMTVIQQRQLLLDAQATLLLNVAQTYYQTLISIRQEAVLSHSLQLQHARVRDIEGRFKSKLALALEVSQAEADEAATSVELSQASNDVRNGRRTLAILIGAAQVDGPLADPPLAPAQPAPESDFVREAEANRQDLLAARAAVEAARYAVDAAIAEYYPSVSLSAAGYLYRENYADASKWNAILLANIPIFSAGGIRADVRAAWSRLRQAALAESYLRRQIEQNVMTAYDNFATSGIELAELRHEVDAAADAYNQSVHLQANGLAIPLDVLTSQDTLLNSQLQYANEAYMRTIDYLGLMRAVGDLNPRTPAQLRPTAGPAAL